MQDKNDTQGAGATAPDASDPRDDEISRLRAEVKRQADASAARAAASAVPSAAPAPAAASVTITKDDLAALLREAVSQGLAQARAATGARPEKPEEVHVVEHEGQIYAEGECTHPLSAHEFFGADGYGKCHADGCRCTGRELGSAAVLDANRQNRAKANGDTRVAVAA